MFEECSEANLSSITIFETRYVVLKIVYGCGTELLQLFLSVLNNRETRDLM